jgi:sodium transport system permease protein
MKVARAYRCLKEIVETARDRRTLGSLLIGPLVGPLLFVVLMNVMVSQSISSVRGSSRCRRSVGADRAPNLLAYLRAREIYL